MKKTLRVLQLAEKWAIVIMFVVMVIASFAQVLNRNIFNPKPVTPVNIIRLEPLKTFGQLIPLLHGQTRFRYAADMLQDRV